MAKYGLETEQTTHLKGMSFGESSDSAGPNLYDYCFILRPERYAHISRNDMNVYLHEFFKNESLGTENLTGTLYYKARNTGKFEYLYNCTLVLDGSTNEGADNSDNWLTNLGDVAFFVITPLV